MIKSFKQFIKEDINHLLSRGVDASRTYFVYDEQTNNTYFFLYNLNGNIVGYQKYNPDYPKEGGLGYLGRYFTKVQKGATGHSKIAVFGLDTYSIDSKYIFIAEGVFDIIKVHNLNEPGIANLGCSVSPQAKNWYSTLPQIKIVIQDRDDAGTELGAVGDYIYTVPEPYKDLGEMPQEEVKKFIENIKNELNLNNISEKKIDIDKFKAAMKRYKENDYLSKTNKKRIKEAGLNHFSKIEKNLKDCLDFFKKQNVENLNDILLDSTDNFSDISFIEISNGLKATGKFPLDPIEIKLKDNLTDNLESIISELDRNFEIKLTRYSELKEEDWWYRYMLRSVKNKDIYEKIILHPIISLNFKYNKDIDDDYDYQLQKDKYSKTTKLLQDSIRDEEVIERYLDSIGYPNLKFTTNYNFDSYYSNRVTIFVTFTL